MTEREVLKLALEALIWARAFIEGDAPVEAWSVNDKAITAIKEALAQPEQEPEIWGCKFNKGNRLDTFYTKSAAERYVEGSLRNGADVSLVGLYTPPPQRKPLTENEIKHLWYEACQTNLELTSQLIVHLARNIEAAVWEKQK